MTRIATTYNQFSGRNIDRLTSLSDNIFAVAMTLLVLDLHIPGAIEIASEHDFLLAIKPLLPRLITYIMSFLTLGIFWIGQQTQHDYIERSNRHYAWLNFAFLSMVTLVPFSTALLATFINFRSALLVYWANIFLLGVTLLTSWLYARNAHLIKPDSSKTFHRAFIIRICTAQVLYAGAVLLCITFSTYVSIGLLVLIQLNYTFAPKLLFRSERTSQNQKS